MPQVPPPAKSTGRITAQVLVLAVALLVTAANAVAFLSHQSLWVDETTQIAGLALGPIRLVPWLVGRGPDLGVPPDRAPPVSYLVQMAWSAAAGGSERSLRWLSVVLACAGAGFTALAARRAYGLAAGVVAALFLGLTPNLAVYAVEVRSYPLFFALAGAAAYLLVSVRQTAPERRGPPLGALGVVLILAMYTHFFGLVLAGAVLATLLLDARRDRAPARPILLCAGALALASSGLLPFVTAAARLSADSPHEGGLRGCVRLLYRLYGHPALAGSSAAIALATAGALACVTAALITRRGAPAVGVLGTGLAAACAAAVVSRGFDATAPHYNVWALPFFAMLVSSGVGAEARLPRALAWLGVASLLTGTAAAAYFLHRSPDVYAHGPQRRIIALVDALGPEHVMIVHDAGSEASGHVFFPLRFTFGRSFPQYACATPCDRLLPFDPRDPIAAAPERDLAVVVRTSHTEASALTRGDAVAAASASPAESLLTARGFNVESRWHWTATVSADVEVLRRSR